MKAQGLSATAIAKALGIGQASAYRVLESDGGNKTEVSSAGAEWFKGFWREWIARYFRPKVYYSCNRSASPMQDVGGSTAGQSG